MQVDAIEKALAIAARNKLTKEHKQKVLFCVWCLLISCVGAWHLLAPPPSARARCKRRTASAWPTPLALALLHLPGCAPAPTRAWSVSDVG